MDRVVNFYARLPRGAAPEPKPTSFFGRYQARYFGKNPSAARKLLYIYPSLLQHGIHTDNRLTSPRPRDWWPPGRWIQHGVLLPSPYVLPYLAITDMSWGHC